MNLLEVIQVDRVIKFDELIMSWFWSHNIQICDVINMIVNHFSVAIMEEIFIKLSLIGHNHLIGSLDKKHVTAGVLICRKTQMDHFTCSWRMWSLSAPIFVQMHVSPASKWSESSHILFDSKDLFMGSGPSRRLKVAFWLFKP